MGDTKIEWTERTWDPVTGCTKVSQGCDLLCSPLPHLISGNIVPCDVVPGASLGIELEKLSLTSAPAIYRGVFLTGEPQPILTLIRGAMPMVYRMVIAGLGKFQIRWSVISFRMINVMNLLPFLERPAQFAFHHQYMLVDVATAVGSWMGRRFDQHITIRGDRPTALPVVIPYPTSAFVSAGPTT